MFMFFIGRVGERFAEPFVPTDTAATFGGQPFWPSIQTA